MITKNIELNSNFSKFELRNNLYKKDIKICIIITISGMLNEECLLNFISKVTGKFMMRFKQ